MTYGLMLRGINHEKINFKKSIVTHSILKQSGKRDNERFYNNE